MIDIADLDSSNVPTRSVSAGQRWRHWKGGEYTIVAIAQEEATGDTVVVYRSEAFGSIWTRALGNFLGATKDVSPSVARFTRITS